MEELRAAILRDDFNTKQLELVSEIINIRKRFPHVTLVAEGVRNTDLGRSSGIGQATEDLLFDLGINALQIYTPKGTCEEPVAENSGFGALQDMPELVARMA